MGSSFLAVLVRTKTGLLGKGSGTGELLSSWLVGVMEEVDEALLNAELSALSTSCVVGGDAALPGAGDAGRGSSSFEEGLEGSKE